jgi:hypothetical protein
MKTYPTSTEANIQTKNAIRISCGRCRSRLLEAPRVALLIDPETTTVGRRCGKAASDLGLLTFGDGRVRVMEQRWRCSGTDR